MTMTLKEAIEFLEGKTTLTDEEACISTGVEMALKMISFAESDNICVFDEEKDDNDKLSKN